MIKLIPLPYEEFKVACSKNDQDWLYRGHASEDWLLESTLFRRQNVEEMSTEKYFQKLKTILSNPKIRTLSDFKALNLNENPFKIGMLYANEKHEKEFNDFFNFMIKLRHLGFPTPILDWTHNPLVALFFAFSGGQVRGKNAAIYRIKINTAGSPFGLQIHQSNFNFSVPNSRHEKQNSSYTIAIRSEHRDTCLPKRKREGVHFHLRNYDNLESKNIVEVEKYVITDTDVIKNKVLKELIIKGYNFESLYGETHPIENTVLQDVIIRHFILDD